MGLYLNPNEEALNQSLRNTIKNSCKIEKV